MAIHPTDGRTLYARLYDSFVCILFGHPWQYGRNERGEVVRTCANCLVRQKWPGPLPASVPGSAADGQSFSDYIFFFPPGGWRSGDGFHKFR